jgi:hypothetical protein
MSVCGAYAISFSISAARNVISPSQNNRLGAVGDRQRRLLAGQDRPQPGAGRKDARRLAAVRECVGRLRMRTQGKTALATSPRRRTPEAVKPKARCTSSRERVVNACPSCDCVPVLLLGSERRGTPKHVLIACLRPRGKDETGPYNWGRRSATRLGRASCVSCANNSHGLATEEGQERSVEAMLLIAPQARFNKEKA